MKISIFSLYGERGDETGVMYLLARYLSTIFPDVSQLRCSGTFSICDRDSENSWRRTLTSCFTCIGESGKLARWSGVKSLATSSYISSLEALQTRRWALELDPKSIETSPYCGVVPFDSCRVSFAEQTGRDKVDPSNAKSVDVARRLVLTAARMLTIGERFSRVEKPDVVLCVERKDALTQSFLNSLKKEKISTVRFEWDKDKHLLKIFDDRINQEYTSELYFTDVDTIRPDEKTWPSPLVNELDKILNLLSLRSGQLALPL